MVYYKKKYVRRPRRKVRRTKSGAKVKSNTVLTKQINSIARKVEQGFQKIYYKRTFEMFPSTPYTWTQINYLSSFTPVFGTFQSDEASNKAYLKAMKIDINLRPNQEPDPVDYSVFIVSLKNNTPKNTYDRNTDTLMLTPDDDYISGVGGTTQGVWLNPKLFNIHMSRRVRTESFPGNQPLVQTRNHRMTFRKYFKTEVYSNPEGNFLLSEIANSKRYFLLCFNNNSALDLTYPALDMTALFEFNVPT